MYARITSTVFLPYMNTPSPKNNVCSGVYRQLLSVCHCQFLKENKREKIRNSLSNVQFIFVIERKLEHFLDSQTHTEANRIDDNMFLCLIFCFKI